MRVHVVSDVHGRADALARAGDGADALICLGDLILFLDYDDHSQGIFPELFGVEKPAEFIALRTAKRFDEARTMSAALWASLDGDPREHIERSVRRSTARSSPRCPPPRTSPTATSTFRASGPSTSGTGTTCSTARRVEIGGLRFGFVGGGLRTQYRTPYEISDEEFAAQGRGRRRGGRAVLHIPPAVPELLYDVVARRFERGSEATLEAIRRTQPRYALFGHVHQPLASRTRIGKHRMSERGAFPATGESLRARVVSRSRDRCVRGPRGNDEPVR